MDKMLVIGSYNIGLTVLGKRIPKVGETVMGDTFDMGPGGKGSNQAIAAARLGGDVSFVTKVGNDLFGRDALELFKREGLSTDHVKLDNDTHTGAGIIFVDEQGRNSIGVALGANLKLSKSDIDEFDELFARCKYLLIQMEVDLSVVGYAIEKAKNAGMTVVLNPAPAHKLDEKYLRLADIVTPNEVEAHELTGVEMTDKESAFAAADVLVRQGVGHVIVTLGSQGCVYVGGEERKYFESNDVKAVDTTGAGDAFNGGLTYALAAGMDIEEAIDFASKVAACSVMHVGVVPGLPTIEQVEKQFGKGGN